MKEASYRTSIAVIHCEGESGNERDDDAGFPRRSFPVGPYDAVHNSVANPVLNLYIVDGCSIDGNI